jgi:hypothetical protein
METQKQDVKSKSKYKISAEVAREELDKLFDYYDLDPSDITDDKQLSAFEGAQAKLIKVMRLGRLEIVEECNIVQTLKNPGTDGGAVTVTYGELSGRAKMEMGKKSETDHHGRMYALLGSLSGLGDAGIAKLKGADLSVAECLGLVFMLV